MYFFVVVSVLVNTQTFLGEDKCSEVGDGIEQSEDAELQPLLPLLHPTTPASTAGGGPSNETRRPPSPNERPALPGAAATGCLVVVVVDLVVVLVTSHRLTVLFTLMFGVLAAEVGVAAVANMVAAATAAAPLQAGMIVSGVVGAAKYCAPTGGTPADAYLLGVAGAAATLLTCSCIYVCSMA